MDGPKKIYIFIENLSNRVLTPGSGGGAGGGGMLQSFFIYEILASWFYFR